MAYFNPFQGVDINVPVDLHEHLVRYCQRESNAVIDQSPFPRMVDMWFLSLAVAARRGLKPADISKLETRKIIDGSIFGSDPWRVHMLMLVAISYSKGVEVTAEPRRMMAIANGLAVTGMPIIIDMLAIEDGEPIWNLSEAMEATVRKPY